MGISIETLAAAKKFTSETVLGGGAVVGKNVTISSITPIEGGNRVTFSYTLDNGTVKTSTMDVMNGVDGIDGLSGKDGKDGQPGKDGSDGIGISKIEKISTVDLVDTYRITFTDNSTFDYEVTNGKDGQGGGTADVPIEKIKVNGELQTPVNKVVDITVPSIEGLTKDADLATVAKSGSYDDLSNKPIIPSLDGYAKTSEIPSKVSELENDSNYLSSIPEEYVTETELSAKGYLTEHQDISGKVDKVEGKSLISDTEIARLASVDNYDDTDIRTELAKKADTTAIPSKVSELTNDSNYQTAEQVNSTVTTEIAKVVADAPEDLNTLKEMSDWIAGHEDDASAMNSAIQANKSDIALLQTGKADKSEIPTELPANGGNADTVNGHTVGIDVPENAVFTDTTYSDATQIEHGLMSVDDKKKLDGLTKYTPDGTTITADEDGTLHVAKVTVDDALSSTSTNPVQNKVVTNEFNHQSTEMMDIKMLGWAVPRECPIQNEVNGNQFIQKVCRVDVGTLDVSKRNDESRNIYVCTVPNIKSEISNNTAINGYCYGWKAVPRDTTWKDGMFSYTSDSKVAFTKDSYTDTASFKQAMQGKYLYYELATPITKTIDGNEIGETVSAVRKETTVNLLNPTIDTDTNNGITFTRNDDGTYSLSGSRIDTSSSAYLTFITNLPLEKGKYKLIGAVDENNFIRCIVNKPSGTNIYDYGDGCILDVNETGIAITLMIVTIDDTSQTRVIKPMLTTNLNATYDDFVPYTGDGETLASDVAEIKNDLGGLTFSASGTTLTITDGTNTWTLGANS